FPDGRRAYCIGQRAQNERPTETPIGVWSNQSFLVRPGGGPNGDVNLWLDLMGKDVAEPDSVVFDPAGRRVFMTCGGGHSVNFHSARGDGDTTTVQHVGAQPRGLAFTPDGRELWVANQLSNDVAVIDPAAGKVVRRIALGPVAKPDPHMLGRFLFNSATLTKGGQFSCNSCHPDGGTDGISWKFVHVPDGLGRETPRNVRVLAGGLGDTAPFRWTGHDRDLEEFIQTEVTKLLGGPTLGEQRVRAMAEYLQSLPGPVNPYRNPDGSMTAEALRGKELFVGKADCAQCHTGPRAGAGRRAHIGTTPDGVDLDVPHLNGVFDSDPYLHDGRAKTLESIWTQHNPRNQHGKVGELTPEERKDLLQYVREL
ncbi:MAG: c-type cytochrome, partial [Armatimonadetes bacterium]|nr:c-type cytochrome [Armatimonadota bacterium]